jgi:hypothetical protein
MFTVIEKIAESGGVEPVEHLHDNREGSDRHNFRTES